jgi:hypothetical protein
LFYYIFPTKDDASSSPVFSASLELLLVLLSNNKHVSNPFRQVLEQLEDVDGNEQSSYSQSPTKGKMKSKKKSYFTPRFPSVVYIP